MKDQCYEFVKGPNNKLNIVGFGSYGEVKLAKNIHTDEMVAIKMIHGRNAKEEIDVHHKLDHPNIIKLLNYYYEKDKNTTYMVLQFAEGGTLNEKIKFEYGQLPKKKIKKYFKEICQAVSYLHSLKYMHRDIKPENILLAKGDQAKLCDFGFAAILEYRSTLCGTYEYMAPEMIQEKPYDHKVDIWALGILLFQLIQGVSPFRGDSGQDVINEMKKPIIFSSRFEKQEIDLIKKILRVNAENRPTISTILEHSYFSDLKEEEQSPKTQASQTSQPSKIISNPYEKQSFASISSKFKDDMSDKYTNEKEFKHYVPQNTKPSFIQNRVPPNPSFQGGNYNKHLTFSQQQLVGNSSTTFKQQNSISSSLAQGLYGKNPPSGSQKSLQNSQASLTRNTMASNHNGSINFVPGNWRKN